MNPRVKNVIPNDDYTLTITFSNEEIRVFDMTKYLDVGIFSELKDKNKFKTVSLFMGSIRWINGQDLCPDTLYFESIPLKPASE